MWSLDLAALHLSINSRVKFTRTAGFQYGTIVKNSQKLQQTGHQLLATRMWPEGTSRQAVRHDLRRHARDYVHGAVKCFASRAVGTPRANSCSARPTCDSDSGTPASVVERSPRKSG